MIIGIDESGNFKTNKLGIYTAVLIRPSHSAKIFKAYETWLQGISDSKKHKGEVKGWLLEDDDICKFIEIVLQNKSASHIKFLAYQVAINDKNTAWLNRNRKSVAIEFRRKAYEFEQSGKNKEKQAYLELARWVEALSPKTLYKLELLGNVVTESILRSLFYATRKHFDRETSKLSVLIDEAFGRPDDPRFNFFWTILLARFTYTNTHAAGGVRFPYGWNNAHPFMRKFVDVKNSHGKFITLTSEYQKAIRFEKSENSIPIQVADIVSSVIFRKEIEKQEIGCYGDLQKNNLVGAGNIPKLTFGNTHMIIVSDKFKLPPPSIEELMNL